MAPALIDLPPSDYVVQKKDTLGLPEPTRARLEKAGIVLSNGYPYRPNKPLYLQDAYRIRDSERDHDERGARADKEKKALLSAATKVTDLTAYIGTEIEGIQLKDLSDQQKDELALLVAERSVVFFRDQDLSPQQQKSLGEHWGEVEVHVSAVLFIEYHPNGALKGLTFKSPKFHKSPALKESPSFGRRCKPQSIQQGLDALAGRPVGTQIWFMSATRQVRVRVRVVRVITNTVVRPDSPPY